VLIFGTRLVAIAYAQFLKLGIEDIRAVTGRIHPL